MDPLAEGAMPEKMPEIGRSGEGHGSGRPSKVAAVKEMVDFHVLLPIQ